MYLCIHIFIPFHTQSLIHCISVIKEVSNYMKLPPWKLTYPLKIDGWKMKCSPFFRIGRFCNIPWGLSFWMPDGNNSPSRHSNCQRGRSRDISSHLDVARWTYENIGVFPLSFLGMTLIPWGVVENPVIRKLKYCFWINMEEKLKLDNKIWVIQLRLPINNVETGVRPDFCRGTRWYIVWWEGEPSQILVFNTEIWPHPPLTQSLLPHLEHLEK